MHGSHVHLLAVHCPRLEDKVAALTVEREPCYVHATVRRHLLDRRPPVTRSVRTHHDALQCQIVQVLLALSRTVNTTYRLRRPYKVLTTVPIFIELYNAVLTGCDVEQLRLRNQRRYYHKPNRHL